MRIGVLETSQDPSETPRKHISKSRAASLVERCYAKWLDKRTIKMTREDQLIKLDYRYRRGKSEPLWIPFLQHREWKEPLLLSYPIADQRSNPSY